MNTNAPLPGRSLAIPFTRAADPNNDLTSEDHRLPLLGHIPDNIRNHFVAMCGEFVGTFLFLFFALSGTQVANSVPSLSPGQNASDAGSNVLALQYIALCFGFSLAVNAWVFFRISGGLFNPAVTVGMCVIGALPWIRGALLFFSQIVGGIAASAVVACLFPGPLNVTTSLGAGTSITQGLFIEMFLTAQLVFTIFMLAAEKHKGTFIAPVGIGLALFIAELTGVNFTGGSLNPARSFGPAVINASFDGYHWIYWAGPMLGSTVAAGFYKFIKVLEYETANPGQDMDHDARIEKKRQLLLAAGINEFDANQVAKELADEQQIMEQGHAPGVDIVVDGPGSTSDEAPKESIYGNGGFRASKENVNDASATQGQTTTQPGAGQTSPQRPALVKTGSSQPGRYSYLGKSGRRSSGNVPQASNRLQSPAMATQDQVYASLDAGGDAPLGSAVRDDNAKSYFNRRPSGYSRRPSSNV